MGSRHFVGASKKTEQECTYIGMQVSMYIMCIGMKKSNLGMLAKKIRQVSHYRTIRTSSSMISPTSEM
jgi:tRNA A37 methylthiotransferase MiaB